MSDEISKSYLKLGYIERLMGVHAILSGESHLELVPDGDEYILSSIQAFSERIDFNPDRKGLKWRYARRLMEKRQPARGIDTWEGKRDVAINALTVLSALMEDVEYSKPGIVGADDAAGISAIIHEFGQMRHVYEPYVGRKDVTSLSASHLAMITKDLSRLKMSLEDLHWSRLKRGVLEVFRRTVKIHADLNRFIESIAESASKLMIYTVNMDRLPSLPAHYAFSIQRFLEDLFGVAHKLGSEESPIVSKLLWRTERRAIEIETPGDSRLFGLLRFDPEIAKWLRQINGDWWIEHVAEDSYRLVLPLRPVDFFAAVVLTEERIRKEAAELIPLVQSIADGEEFSSGDKAELVQWLDWMIKLTSSKENVPHAGGMLGRLEHRAASEGTPGDKVVLEYANYIREELKGLNDLYQSVIASDEKSIGKKLKALIEDLLEDEYTVYQTSEVNRIVAGFMKLAGELGGAKGTSPVNLEFLLSQDTLIIKNSDRRAIEYIWGAYEVSNPHLLPSFISNAVTLAGKIAPRSRTLAINRNAAEIRIPLVMRQGAKGVMR